MDTQQISSVSPFNKGSESMVRIQREHWGPMSCFGNEIKMLDFNLIFLKYNSYFRSYKAMTGLIYCKFYTMACLPTSLPLFERDLWNLGQTRHEFLQ